MRRRTCAQQSIQTGLDCSSLTKQLAAFPSGQLIGFKSLDQTVGLLQVFEDSPWNPIPPMLCLDLLHQTQDCQGHGFWILRFADPAQQ